MLWTRTGDGLLDVERAGPHLARAVTLYEFSQTISKSLITSRLTYTAVTPADTVIYHKALSVSVKPLSTKSSSSTGGGVALIGDLEPDGALDVNVVNSASTQTVSTQRSATQIGVIDSKTGEFHPVALQDAADGSLRKGHGTDLLAARVHDGRPVIIAWRGVNQHLYYRRMLKVISGARGVWVDGIRVSGHDCSDITLSAATASRAVTGVLSARGQLLWTVDFATSHPTGGTLVHHKRPKLFCL